MTGVSRGARVRFSVHKNDQGQVVRQAEGEALRGTVLDRGHESGSWWVMPADAGRAVLVKSRDMEPTVVQG